MGRSMRPVAVLVGGAAAVLLAAGPALAAPSVTLSHASGLANGDAVTVTVAGFPANTRVGVDECSPLAAANGTAACDTAHLVVITTNAAGSGSASYPVTTGNVGTMSGSTCPPSTGNCVITAAEMTDNTVAAFAPLSFGASTVAAAPTASPGSGSAAGSGSVVPGATATSTGKPFGLEMLVAALLLVAAAASAGVAARRVHARG